MWIYVFNGFEMKLFLVLLFAAVTAKAINVQWSYGNNIELDFDEEWTNFKDTNKRRFHSSSQEDERKSIFAENMDKIMRHNLNYERGIKSYKMGVNQFTDMTPEEFRQYMSSPMNISKSGSTFLPLMNSGKLPNEVDWTKNGYVTPVKNQGHCGSCWAFSATGAIEGQHFRKTGKLVSLSEQNLVDCSRGFHNDGCYGGFMDNAFEYVAKNAGIDTEESYPYIAFDQKCKFKKDSVGAIVTGYVDIEKSEDKLKEAIGTVGPISVAINAGLGSFQHYFEGVYDEPGCNPEDINHGVLAVGYGSEDGKDYYLVKNSWGNGWGDKGYIKMARNKNNQCGITRAASYPLV